jgi:hypothetical protein
MLAKFMFAGKLLLSRLSKIDQPLIKYDFINKFPVNVKVFAFIKNCPISVINNANNGYVVVIKKALFSN